MAKTYVTGAVLASRATHRYLTRYQQQLSGSATTDQLSALVDLIACIAVFLSKWHVPTPLP